MGIGDLSNGQFPTISPRLSAINIPQVSSSSTSSVSKNLVASAKIQQTQKQNQTSKTSKLQKQVSFSLEPDQAISVITIPIPTFNQQAPTSQTLRVLWDSGAKGSFIDISFANHPSIQPFRRTLETPSPLQMFDGRPSSSGPITHTVNLPLVLQNGLASLLTTLYVTRLAGADIVLGDDWLAKYQAILDHAQRHIQLTLPSSSPSITSSNPIPIASPSCWGSSSFLGQPAISSSDSTPDNHSLSLALNPSVNNDTLLRAVSIDSFPSDSLDFDDLKTLGPQFSEILTPEEFVAETAELLEVLPTQFHDYIDIFQPSSGTKTLQPHCQYDMTIDLVPEAKLSSPPLYQLNEGQCKVLLDTLERETTAGHIRPSKSSYGVPMFFVPKKDGKFHMVVDYRQVNCVTKPDAYPLPLISQIISDLSKAKFFTKLDLVGAYQLLRISPGHEPLTAFRTQYGMFESLVIRDGLRNAPATFQHFLNNVFRNLLGKGVTIYIDNILIFAASQEELHVRGYMAAEP